MLAAGRSLARTRGERLAATVDSHARDLEEFQRLSPWRILIELDQMRREAHAVGQYKAATECTKVLLQFMTMRVEVAPPSADPPSKEEIVAKIKAQKIAPKPVRNVSSSSDS